MFTSLSYFHRWIPLLTPCSVLVLSALKGRLTLNNCIVIQTCDTESRESQSCSIAVKLTRYSLFEGFYSPQKFIIRRKGISNRKRHDSLDYTLACTTVILATTSEVHKLNNEQFTCTTHVHNRKCRTNSNKKLRPAAGPIKNYAGKIGASLAVVGFKIRNIRQYHVCVTFSVTFSQAITSHFISVALFDVFLRLRRPYCSIDT